MIDKDNQKIDLITYKGLSQFTEITAFTTTRMGGISSGNYAMLNLSEYAGDEYDDVAKNRAILAKHIGISTDDFVIPFQTHEDKIQVIPEGFRSYSLAEQKDFLHGVDALITNFPDFCIGITTADCVPVLLYDPVKKIIAAIHAGWRGTVKRITEKTVQQMQRRFGCIPGNIQAAIGPCISIKAFEVGNEVFSEFEKKCFPMEQMSFLNAETNKHHIDLVKANEYLLVQSGVNTDHIESLDVCTYENSNDFFSARKLGIHSGRMLTAIMMKNIHNQ